MEYYRSISQYGKEKFGEKIYKLPIDGGFSCPNRERGRACIFCSDEGSGEFTVNAPSIGEQIQIQKQKLEKKSAKKYIAYFQSFTNTYGDVKDLEGLYREALADEDVLGIAIATRADALPDDVLDLLEAIHHEKECWLEIGVQSIHEKTLQWIRRGYDHLYLKDKIRECHDRNLRTIAHLIYGFPTENRQDFLETVQEITEMGFWGVKFHSLYIQENAPLYDLYKENPFDLITKENYTKTIAKAIGYLRGDMVVHRLTGDPDKRKKYLPRWCGDKLSVIGSIQKELKLKNIKQGLFRK